MLGNGVVNRPDADSIQEKLNLFWLQHTGCVRKLVATVPEPQPALISDETGDMRRRDFDGVSLFYNLTELYLVNSTSLRQHHPRAVLNAISADPQYVLPQTLCTSYIPLLQADRTSDGIYLIQRVSVSHCEL